MERQEVRTCVVRLRFVRQVSSTARTVTTLVGRTFQR